MEAETIIYHNPNCGTSRKVLGMLREAGLEPKVIEYLKTPPTRTELLSLLDRMGKTPMPAPQHNVFASSPEAKSGRKAKEKDLD